MAFGESDSPTQIVTPYRDDNHCRSVHRRIIVWPTWSRRWQAPLGVPVTKFRDIEHLIRLAAVFLVGIALFLVLRAHFVPRSFGHYGHYRGDAVGEASAKPVKFAGHQVCEGCHSDVAQVKQAGPHAHVNCEACHGALAPHADDPVSIKPQLPDTAVLCVKCHEANAAKPKGFPQVVSLDHSSGAACKTCHLPHNPKQMPGGAKQ